MTRTEFTQLLPADLIFTHGDALVSRAIRWMTRSAGELRTYANHVAIGGTNNTVIESGVVFGIGGWMIWLEGIQIPLLLNALWGVIVVVAGWGILCGAEKLSRWLYGPKKDPRNKESWFDGDD